MNYLIYKITNTVNNKIYIGKTKEYYKEKYIGIEGRFKNHLLFAKSKSSYNDCPKLYNAIRKYGNENFKVELVEKTSEDQINEKEMYYIKLFDSTNDEIGYNIALGGGGRSVVNVNDDIRSKISKKQSSNGEMNIKPYLNDNNEHVGYFARRRENGKIFQKYFTSTVNSLEENLNLARKWIEEIKQNKIDNAVKYNKSNDLPKNINCIKDEKDKSKIIGYRVDIMLNGKKTSKSFQSKNDKLEDILKKAIDFKESILNAK